MELVTFDFDLYYQKETANAKADSFSRYPPFTSRERGTTAAGAKTLLTREQWLEVGEMKIDDEGCNTICSGA